MKKLFVIFIFLACSIPAFAKKGDLYVSAESGAIFGKNKTGKNITYYGGFGYGKEVVNHVIISVKQRYQPGQYQVGLEATFRIPIKK